MLFSQICRVKTQDATVVRPMNLDVSPPFTARTAAPRDHWWQAGRGASTFLIGREIVRAAEVEDAEILVVRRIHVTPFVRQHRMTAEVLANDA